MERQSSLYTRLLAVALLFAFGGFAASPAMGQTADERPVTPEESRRITETLSAEGYTEIHDIEVDDGRFEVDARHPDGHEVDLELDLETLEILFEDRD